MALPDQSQPGSPLLQHCPATLPASAYLDADWFQQEQQQVWSRNWIYVGRASDLAPLSIRRVEVAGQQLLLVCSREGDITCFHNTCRHRGSELCSESHRQLKRPLITCPYHQWSYDLSGRLVSTAFASRSADFDAEQHALFPVAVKQWNGCLFICLMDDPVDFSTVPDIGVEALDNWPMDDLVSGYRFTREIHCNWKIFWENYNECLHCPGIHPELSERVPVYRRGIMAASEAIDFDPDGMAEPVLQQGARSWTLDGNPCGPEFSQLSTAERESGHVFVTLLPSMFIVAHVDYVRIVSLTPVDSEHTRLTAEWLFPVETLSASNFDLENVIGFATTVLEQDAAACELNQRGLASSRYQFGSLMPEEFEVYRFQQWIRRQMDQPQ